MPTLKARLAMFACFGTCAMLGMGPADVAASPKGYDIERLLREEMPSWRSGGAAPAPTSGAQPLDRIPNVPSPSVVPPRAPPPATVAPAAAAVAEPSGLRVIQKPGSPLSTVSRAWSKGG